MVASVLLYARHEQALPMLQVKNYDDEDGGESKSIYRCYYRKSRLPCWHSRDQHRAVSKPLMLIFKLEQA